VAFDLVIRNGTVVTSGGSRVADVGVRGETIAAIEPGLEPDAASADIDATGLHVLPGVIDDHVHFREPGLEHEETWLSGTRAAVFGGVTTVLDMPNTVPPTDTVMRAEHKLTLARASAYCDFGIFGLLGTNADSVAELVLSESVAGLKCFLGPTTGGLSGPDDDELRRALVLARQAGARVAFHAEDRALISQREASIRAARRTDARAHLESRPAEAEVAAIGHAARLLQESDAAGHILHLSSADGVAATDAWRARGVDLTCETTPHHMLLDDDVYRRFGAVAKVNPPIRTRRDSAELAAALRDGRIDVVASDHAPHVLADKQRDSIWDCAAGFAGVETMLPLLLTEVAAGRLTMERLVRAASEGPARTWGLYPSKGALEVGSDADLTLVDVHREGVIEAYNLHGLYNHSPFEGRKTVGAPLTTIVRGRLVVRDGALVASPGWGRAVSRS
jgi:dihydroorotase